MDGGPTWSIGCVPSAPRIRGRDLCVVSTTTMVHGLHSVLAYRLSVRWKRGKKPSIEPALLLHPSGQSPTIPRDAQGDPNRWPGRHRQSSSVSPCRLHALSSGGPSTARLVSTSYARRVRALPAVRTALPPVEVASSCLLATRSRCQRAAVWNISGCETRVSLIPSA